MSLTANAIWRDKWWAGYIEKDLLKISNNALHVQWQSDERCTVCGYIRNIENNNAVRIVKGKKGNQAGRQADKVHLQPNHMHK